MKKPNSVFVIRCYSINLKSKDKRIIGERTWGFYSTMAMARKAVLNNWTDIFELDFYNFAVIMEMPEGVCVSPIKNEWYSNKYSRKTKKHTIKKIEFDPINMNRSSKSFKYFISW